nr:putative capsid [Marmot picobirnavirus]
MSKNRNYKNNRRDEKAGGRGNGNNKRNYKSKDSGNSYESEPKGRSIRDRSTLFTDASSARNDWHWYAKDEKILLDTASYPYGVATGTRFLQGVADYNASSNNWTLGDEGNYIPGIAVAHFAYTPVSFSGTQGDPANVAARNLFVQIRRANSGAANYAAPDMMMAFIALGEAYSLHNALVRLYGTVLYAKAKNKYTGPALVSAMGCDFRDLSTNLTRLRNIINVMASTLNKRPVPQKFPIFARWSWLTNYVFKDGTGDKVQYYVPMPRYMHVFDETSESTGTSLKTIDLTGTFDGTATVDQIAELINQVLTPLMNSTSLDIICGDVDKAFGSEVYSLGYILNDYTIEPVESEQFNLQFANAHIFDVSLDIETHGDLSLRQDPNTNAIYMVKPTLLTNHGTGKYCMSHTIINTDNPDAGAETTIEARAFMWLRKKQGNEVSLPDYLPSEVITSVDYMCYSDTTSGAPFALLVRITDQMDLTESADLLTTIGAFRYHPPYILSNMVANAPALWRQYANFTMLSAEDLEHMNGQIMYSAYDIW